MTDPNGPQATPDEPQAPQFGASSPGAAPAPGQPAQPFSSPAPGAMPQAPGASGQHVPPQQPPAAPPYGAPGQQVPPQQPYGAPQYGAPGQPQYGAPGGAPMTPQDEKQWAMFGHLGGILWVFGLGWLGPLIVFLMYKDRSPFVKQESKEALNFQLLMTIVGVGGSIVVGILTVITFGLASILYLIVAAAPVLGIIFGIVGGVRVNGGGSYRYPFNWRIIK